MKYLQYTIFFIVLTACTKDIPYQEQFPFEGEKIVVFARLNPDSLVSISVSKSFPSFETVSAEETILPDAQVELYEENNLIETLTYAGNSFFKSNNEVYPLIGKSYHFKISHPELSSIETVPQIIPDFVPLDNYNISSDNNNLRIDFEFSDSATQENYYNVELSGVRLSLGTEPFILYLLGLFPDGDLSCAPADEQTFKDICFSGQTGYFSVIPEDEIGTPTDWQNEQLFFILRSTNKAYYEYRRIRDIDYPPGFGTPPTEYSNVIGGYGAVFAYNQDIIIINL